MARAYIAPVLSAALSKFKQIVAAHAEKDGFEGKRLVVFCEDRLSLAAERAVCEQTGGTFAISVYTLSRFLSAEWGRADNVLTSQGSAMAMRKIIEENRSELQMFRSLSSAEAAQQVYDTIALLYSSEISPDDLAGVRTENAFLQRKLHDLGLLYAKYSQYLKDTGAVDRNAYLRRLPEVIASSEKIIGADVVFLGFQAFTSAVAHCVRACMETADEVYGLFIGGSERKYVNEGWVTFKALAKKVYGEECAVERLPSGLRPEAEHMRKYVFEPEIFHGRQGKEVSAGRINIISAADEEEECEFFAAQILKRVQEGGIKYGQISVMLPDLNAYQPSIERVFGEYALPYYVDRRYPLVSHPACAFICDYLDCAYDGCREESVCAAVNSPLFPFKREAGMFVNYLLRAASFRGAVKKPASAVICEERGFSLQTVERVRKEFLAGLSLLPRNKADGREFCEGVRKLLIRFDAETRLKELSDEATECGYPSVAAMSARAYGEILKVLDEAEKLTSGEKLSVKEFAAVLKSGFTAAEISLIPPKQDAVFISDLTGCANTGTEILFVGGLTDAVPVCSQDTAVLTDGELTSLEKLHVAVSPKISQVNKRVKEVTALNLCAFSDELFLSYPMRRGGEECGVSEVISYAQRLFNINGRAITAVTVKDLSLSDGYIASFNARPAPALRNLSLYAGGSKAYGERQASAVYKSLCRRIEKGEADESLRSALSFVVSRENKKERFDCSALYGTTVSPTTLETFFSCPYKAFMQRGLKLEERRENSFRPLESGNFIHAVLEGVAKKLNSFTGAEECEKEAREIAAELLQSREYLTQSGDAAANYSANALAEEAVRISLGMYEQLKNSHFTVQNVESRCGIDLGGGVSVGGVIDRIDSCGDMVRVIDYKTGHIDDSPSSYYMGLKLQLPLYLLSASEGKRAAGAYYFPANCDYTPEGGVSFTLRGFMDGSEEVVKNSDTTVQEKEYSEYVGAYLNGRKLDRAMPRDEFESFLSYSRKIASSGARSLTGGVITPSPVDGACGRCKFAGCCGYDAESCGEREVKKADCATIAEIARTVNQKEEEGK